MTESIEELNKPDIHSSSEDYAKRFSGEAGKFILSVQTDSLVKIIKSFGANTILDVGGGHCQNISAYDLLKVEYVIHGSDPRCLKRANTILGYEPKNIISPLQSLAASDRQYDIAVCFRQLTHLPANWRELVAELCRVSQKSVIVDFPTICSFNIFYSLLFKIKRMLEGNTREFIVFREQEVIMQFKQNGYELKHRYPQFLLPIVFHRLIKNETISKALETLFFKLKLTKFFGSPIIAAFTPIGN